MRYLASPALPVLPSDPAGPVDGTLYINSGTSYLGYYQSNTWWRVPLLNSPNTFTARQQISTTNSNYPSGPLLLSHAGGDAVNRYLDLPMASSGTGLMARFYDAATIYDLAALDYTGQWQSRTLNLFPNGGPSTNADRQHASGYLYFTTTRWNIGLGQSFEDTINLNARRRSNTQGDTYLNITGDVYLGNLLSQYISSVTPSQPGLTLGPIDGGSTSGAASKDSGLLTFQSSYYTSVANTEAGTLSLHRNSAAAGDLYFLLTRPLTIQGDYGGNGRISLSRLDADTFTRTFIANLDASAMMTLTSKGNTVFSLDDTGRIVSGPISINARNGGIPAIQLAASGTATAGTTSIDGGQISLYSSRWTGSAAANDVTTIQYKRRSATANDTYIAVDDDLEFTGYLKSGMYVQAATYLNGVTDVQFNGRSISRGLFAPPVTLTANSANTANSTTLVDISGLAVTATLPTATRTVDIQVQGQIQSSVAADRVAVYIREGTTTLQSIPIALPTASTPVGFFLKVAVVAPTAGAHTYKISIARLTGTGTVTLVASATALAQLTVADAGPST